MSICLPLAERLAPPGGLTSDINGLYDIPYKMFAVKK